MGSDILPPSPLYDPTGIIRNFIPAQDYAKIRLILAGTSVLYKDPGHKDGLEVVKDNAGNVHDVEWRRPKEICKNPKFVDGKHDRFDALQGPLMGDCWVVSAIEALTFNQPLINYVAPFDQSFNDDDYFGAFHFRIWELGSWYDVVVDDRLPVLKNTKKLVHCRSRSGDVFWAALLEKAYVKFWGARLGNLSYDVLDSGDYSTSLLNFTGGIIEVVCGKKIYQKKYDYLPNGATLKSFLYEAYTRNALMGCMGFGRLSQSLQIRIHNYTITAILKCADDDPVFSHHGVGLYLLRILNPWGKRKCSVHWFNEDRYDEEWTDEESEINRMIRKRLGVDGEEDGEFWMSEENLEKHSGLVYICHLGPGRYVNSRHAKLITGWKTSCFRGEWVKGFSAGGKNPDKRHLLPQIGIELKAPENAIHSSQETCYVLIHLTHRGKYRPFKNCPPKKFCEYNNVGFYIYDTSSITGKGLLGKRFFKSNKPLNKEPNWEGGDGRSYALGLYMTPGRYCIVPCTQFEGYDSQYLLRVVATSQVDHWEYDNRILKYPPLAEYNLVYTDKLVHTIFTEVAQNQNEIDWSGLQYIFDCALDANRSYFGIFKSIANYLLFIFWMLSSLRPFNYFGNENVNFTKDQCRSMIAIFDHDHSGKLDITEFGDLWNKTNSWIKVYNRYRDKDTGLLLVDRLRDALGAIGYSINTRSAHSLSFVYADEGKIRLTDFVLCGVALETALSRMENEALGSGRLTLTLEQWVKLTLRL